MKGFKKVSPETKTTILNAIKEGQSVADAAKEYGISTASIYQWKNKKVGKTVIAKPAATKMNMNFTAFDREILAFATRIVNQSMAATLEKLI